MKYVMRDVWCVMCDVTDLIFCKILTIWVKGSPKTPHPSDLWPFLRYSKINPRWHSYVHDILQGLLSKAQHKGEGEDESVDKVKTDEPVESNTTENAIETKLVEPEEESYKP